MTLAVMRGERPPTEEEALLEDGGGDDEEAFSWWEDRGGENNEQEEEEEPEEEEEEEEVEDDAAWFGWNSMQPRKGAELLASQDDAEEVEEFTVSPPPRRIVPSTIDAVEGSHGNGEQEAAVDVTDDDVAMADWGAPVQVAGRPAPVMYATSMFDSDEMDTRDTWRTPEVPNDSGNERREHCAVLGVRPHDNTMMRY